jgi:hypothetical protein
MNAQTFTATDTIDQTIKNIFMIKQFQLIYVDILPRSQI